MIIYKIHNTTDRLPDRSCCFLHFLVLSALQIEFVLCGGIRVHSNDIYRGWQKRFFYLHVGPTNVNVVNGVYWPLTLARIRKVPGARSPLWIFVPLLPKRKYGVTDSTRRRTRLSFWYSSIVTAWNESTHDTTASIFVRLHGGSSRWCRNYGSGCCGYSYYCCRNYP